MISLNPLQLIPTSVPMPGKATAIDPAQMPGIAGADAQEFSLALGKIDQTAAPADLVSHLNPVKHGDRGIPVRFPNSPLPLGATFEIPTALPLAAPPSPHDLAQPPDKDAPAAPADDPADTSRATDSAQVQLTESLTAALPLPAQILPLIPHLSEISSTDLPVQTRQASAPDPDTSPSPPAETAGLHPLPNQFPTRPALTQTRAPAPAPTAAAVSLTPDAWPDILPPEKPLPTPPDKTAPANAGTETGTAPDRPQPALPPRAETRLSGDQTSVVGVALSNVRLPGPARSLPTDAQHPADRRFAKNPDQIAPGPSPVVKTEEFSTDPQAPLSAPTRLPDHNDALVHLAPGQNTRADRSDRTPLLDARAAPAPRNSQPALPAGPIPAPDHPRTDPSQPYRPASASQFATFPQPAASDPATPHTFSKPTMIASLAPPSPQSVTPASPATDPQASTPPPPHNDSPLSSLPAPVSPAETPPRPAQPPTFTVKVSSQPPSDQRSRPAPQALKPSGPQNPDRPTIRLTLPHTQPTPAASYSPLPATTRQAQPAAKPVPPAYLHVIAAPRYAGVLPGIVPEVPIRSAAYQAAAPVQPIVPVPAAWPASRPISLSPPRSLWINPVAKTAPTISASVPPSPPNSPAELVPNLSQRDQPASISAPPFAPTPAPDLGHSPLNTQPLQRPAPPPATHPTTLDFAAHDQSPLPPSLNRPVFRQNLPTPKPVFSSASMPPPEFNLRHANSAFPQPHPVPEFPLTKSDLPAATPKPGPHHDAFESPLSAAEPLNPPVAPSESTTLPPLEPLIAMAGPSPTTSPHPDRITSPHPGRGLPKGLATTLVRAAARPSDDRVELTLDPLDLGKLRFSIAQSGDQLQVTLSVQRPETLDLLRRHVDDLRQEFRAAGFAGASLNFSQWGQQSDNRHTDSQPLDTFDPTDAASLPETLTPSPGSDGSGLHLRL